MIGNSDHTKNREDTIKNTSAQIIIPSYYILLQILYMKKAWMSRSILNTKILMRETHLLFRLRIMLRMGYMQIMSIKMTYTKI